MLEPNMPSIKIPYAHLPSSGHNAMRFDYCARFMISLSATKSVQGKKARDDDARYDPMLPRRGVRLTGTHRPLHRSSHNQSGVRLALLSSESPATVLRSAKTGETASMVTSLCDHRPQILQQGSH